MIKFGLYIVNDIMEEKKVNQDDERQFVFFFFSSYIFIYIMQGILFDVHTDEHLVFAE